MSAVKQCPLAALELGAHSAHLRSTTGSGPTEMREELPTADALHDLIAGTVSQGSFRK